MDSNSMSPRLRSKNRIRVRVAHSPNHRIIVMLPEGNGRLLKIMARSVLIIMAVVSFPWIRSTVGSIDTDNLGYRHDVGPVDDYFFLPILFRELSNEGLLRSGSRGALIGELGIPVLEDLDMDLDLVVYESGANCMRSIASHSLDFVFADSLAVAGEFVERVLKIGGIMAVRMSGGDALDDVVVPPNYKIVYVHHFDATVVAMQKMGEPALPPPAKRSLCGDAMDARKAAMCGLEDVLLEPPQLNSAELDQYVERTKYLPDLLGVSLDQYPRRVFIDVGLPGAAPWFERRYPTGNQVFEMYNVELEMGGGLVTGLSDWFGRIVREEEFVVVKADADVVEEMVRSKAICLVDELFLECKQQGQSGNKVIPGGKAYWECLALLGRLRNEGIAVHQWWG